MRKLIVRIYERLLRLYPLRFREAFAGEMLDLFDQVVHDARIGRLVAQCARELWDLLPSLIREHLHERHAPQMEMMASPGYTFNHRFCVISILTGEVLYLTLIILPFFAYGLHLEDPNPKYFPIFCTPLGAWLRFAGVYTLALFPVWNTFFGLRLLFSAGRNWRRWVKGQRRLVLGTLAASTALMAFIFSPAGQLMMKWYMD
jgi:hypothetical protein